MPGPKLECGAPRLQCATQSVTTDRRCRSFNRISQSRHSRRMLPINRSQQMRSLEGSTQAFQHDQTHRIHGAVHSRRVDAVAIVNQKSLPLIARHKRAELLHGPCCRRVLGRIPMQDPARADVQNDEDVDHAERRSDRHTEITPQYRADVIPHEGAPCLRPRIAPRRVAWRHIAPDGPR
jgi:hypothetical protein